MKTIVSKNKMLPLFLIILVFFSCKKNSDVSPAHKKLSYQFKVAANLPGANLTWQSGFANVSSISFGGDNQNKNNKHEDDLFMEPTVFKVDLFKTGIFLGNVDIATGNYHNVKIKVELKQTATDPALFLKGTYASSSGSKPVELSFNEGSDQFEILVTAKDLNVGAKQHYIEDINLHLDKLMAGVTSNDLNSATITGGSIIINKTSNIAIYAKIKANINSFSDANNEN